MTSIMIRSRATEQLVYKYTVAKHNSTARNVAC